MVCVNGLKKVIEKGGTLQWPLRRLFLNQLYLWPANCWISLPYKGVTQDQWFRAQGNKKLQKEDFCILPLKVLIQEVWYGVHELLTSTSGDSYADRLWTQLYQMFPQIPFNNKVLVRPQTSKVWLQTSEEVGRRHKLQSQNNFHNNSNTLFPFSLCWY